MTTALTYDSLIDDIKNYAERSDSPFIDQIPRLIMLAENRIASEVRGLGFQRVAQFNLINANPIYEKPARWRETRSLSVNGPTERVYLKPRSYEYCRAFQDETGVPNYYSDYDYEHFYLASSPNDDYAAELIYHERPEPLGTSNQTSWTTQYAPQVLLYATLLEAQPFLKLPERLAEFQGLYERAATSIAKEDTARVVDFSVLRSK
jgi:hypothetical protein